MDDDELEASIKADLEAALAEAAGKLGDGPITGDGIRLITEAASGVLAKIETEAGDAIDQMTVKVCDHDPTKIDIIGFGEWARRILEKGRDGQ